MLLNDPRVDPTMDESMPIQLAAQSGHSEIVKLLLEDGRANPNRAAGNPLVCASAYGDVKVVGLLLADPRVDPSVRDNLPLLRACEQNALEVARMLLQRPEVNPHNGNKPLLSACTGGHFDIVKLLVNEYDVDPASPFNQPFFNACYSGNLDLIKFLLSFDSVDPSKPDNNASFQIAAQMGHTEVINLLIKDPRVDPTVRDNYSLDIASVSGYLDVVKILLADPLVRSTCDLTSPLRLAVEGEQEEVLRYFLSLDDPGFAPTPSLFCEACEIGNVDIVKILISDPRVNPHARHIQFPVQFAAVEGNLEVYKLLVADPRVHPEEEGDLALIGASQRGHTEIVKEMLADPRIQNFDRALIEALLHGVDGVVNIISTSDRIDRSTLASNPQLSEAFGKACTHGYADCVRNLLESIPQFRVSINDVLEASRLGHVGTLQAIHELRTIDCEEAVGEAGTEKAFLHLLAWWGWRRWRLLKLGLTDIQSTLSTLPADLYLDFVRVLLLGFDQEGFRQ
jgi:ankyrin repeat protein